jgi:hypothetical protein
VLEAALSELRRRVGDAKKEEDSMTKFWSMCINCEAVREGHHKDEHCGYPVEHQIGEDPKFDDDATRTTQLVECKGGEDCVCVPGKPRLKVYLRNEGLIVSEMLGAPEDNGERWVALNMAVENRHIEIHEAEVPKVIAALQEFIDQKPAVSQAGSLAEFTLALLQTISRHGARSQEVKNIVREHESIDGAHDMAMLLILAAEAKDQDAQETP